MKFINLLLISLSINVCFSQEDTNNISSIQEWISINLNLELPTNSIIDEQFNLKNYELPLPGSLREILKTEEWIGDLEIREFESTEDGIVLVLNSDDSKIILLTENYFVMGFHGIIGNYKQTLIYDFAAKNTSFNYEVFGYGIFSKDVLRVGKDYYDTRDVEDPEYAGHIFEVGTFDLKTNKYTFLGFE